VGRVVLVCLGNIAGKTSERFRRKLEPVERVFKDTKCGQELLIGGEHVRFEQRISRIRLEGGFEVADQLQGSR